MGLMLSLYIYYLQAIVKVISMRQMSNEQISRFLNCHLNHAENLHGEFAVSWVEFDQLQYGTDFFVYLIRLGLKRWHFQIT